MRDTTLVKLMVFGSVSAHPAAEEAMRRVFGRIDWPVTWVEGAAGDDDPIAGMQAFAFSAGRVDRITLNGRVVGSVFEEGAIRYCLLGGLGPGRSFRLAPRSIPANAGTSGNRPGTGRFLAGRCRRGPGSTSMSFSRWYGAFNEARTRGVFAHQISQRIVAGQHRHFRPKSGGTRAGGRRLGAATAGLLRAGCGSPLPFAMSGAGLWQFLQPGHGDFFACRPAAFDFRHGQRRARRRRRYGRETSASKSISTMEVVEAILASRGFDFSDITRATAYFKNRADMPEFPAWCAARDLRSLPAIMAQCGICRDELLFELEADAWKATPAV